MTYNVSSGTLNYYTYSNLYQLRVDDAVLKRLCFCGHNVSGRHSLLRGSRFTFVEMEQTLVREQLYVLRATAALCSLYNITILQRIRSCGSEYRMSTGHTRDRSPHALHLIAEQRFMFP